MRCGLLTPNLNLLRHAQRLERHRTPRSGVFLVPRVTFGRNCPSMTQRARLCWQAGIGGKGTEVKLLARKVEVNESLSQRTFPHSRYQKHISPL
ncbi:hypothetical protein Taro_020344 [Colocasia esculenta]|uniref:Uncharacterized protein n=1 Tax=Colocasia esculenta TaxID=4460 RepID=A0A843UW31_COLES|nr:hypothetical protein [Colocasia esculenta]